MSSVRASVTRHAVMVVLAPKRTGPNAQCKAEHIRERHLHFYAYGVENLPYEIRADNNIWGHFKAFMMAIKLNLASGSD